MRLSGKMCKPAAESITVRNIDHANVNLLVQGSGLIIWSYKYVGYIIWLIIAVMGEFTVISFEACSMQEEFARNPDE
jgi:hypothetical protein